jgi:hypothetical protein
VAEDGIVTDGEHRCRPHAARREDAMADGIDTAMQRVEPAALETPADRPPPEPDRLELRASDDPCWRAASPAMAASTPRSCT